MDSWIIRACVGAGLLAVLSFAGVTAAGDEPVSAARADLPRRGTTPIRVVVLDETRTRFCGVAWDTNFLTGNVFSGMRNAVLNPAFFGIGGVVDRPIELTAVSDLTDPVLESADAVFLSSMNPDEILEACELERVQAFVDQGGGLFVFENRAADRYAELFGGTGGASSTGPDVIFQTDIITQGPFGNVAGLSMPLGFHLTFLDLGPNGRSFATDSPSGTVGAVFDYGLGRAVMFNDEEWLASYNSPSGCGNNSQNGALGQTVFLNSVAYIVPDAGFAYQGIGNTCCAADFNGDGLLNFFDISRFIDAFTNMEPAADFDANGLWNFFDVSAYIAAFNAGCP
ncbi:MAG: GC-type dockerin domain-anchored protein [Phycisphaerales bacterium]